MAQTYLPINCYIKSCFNKHVINEVIFVCPVTGLRSAVLAKGIWRRANVSKISNTFPFLIANKILVTRAGIHKMLVRIANREDPDQAASSEAA